MKTTYTFKDTESITITRCEKTGRLHISRKLGNPAQRMLTNLLYTSLSISLVALVTLLISRFF